MEAYPQIAQMAEDGRPKAYIPSLAKESESSADKTVACDLGV
jgi:hypothetical protein